MMDYFFFCDENGDNLEKLNRFIEENGLDDYINTECSPPTVEINPGEFVELDKDFYIIVDEYQLVVCPDSCCESVIF